MAFVAGGLGVVVLVTLVAGRTPFAVAVVVLALIAAIDASAGLRRVGPAPVLPAVLLLGVGAPVAAAVDPGAGWDVVSTLTAAALLLAVLLLLLFGRRQRVTEALGATMLAGLFVGVGTGGALLLRDLPDGFRWMLGIGLLVAAADSASALVTWMRARRPPLAAVLGSALAVVVVGAVLALAWPEPFRTVAAVAVAAVALCASLAGGGLRAALAASGGTPTAHPVVGALTSALIAIPATYLVTRMLTL